MVREYNRTVGDHPDVSDDGPPLTITWDYIQLPNVPVQYYEAKKKRRRQRRLERRRQKQQQQAATAAATAAASTDGLPIVPVPLLNIPNLEMTVPRIRGPGRRELLWSEFDVSAEDLREAEDEVKRVAAGREESCRQSVLSEKTEELWESAQRKVRRSFLGGGALGGGSNHRQHPGSDEAAIYNATVLKSSSGSSTTRKRSTAGFAASLRVEALRRQMGGCVGVGPNSKYGIMAKEAEDQALIERGPEPDGRGGWKIQPKKSLNSPIVFLGRGEEPISTQAQ